MAGIVKTINRGGFDLSYWTVIEGVFPSNPAKMIVKLAGYKDKAALQAGHSHFQGAEITRVFDWSAYDGSNLISWIYNKCLEPVWEDNSQTVDINIFKDGVIDLT